MSTSDEQPRDPQDPQEVGALDLTDEVARKYDPERLLKLVSKRAGKQEALDANVRHRYERRLGVDLGHVRVITGEFAEEFNKRKNAYATTIGGTGMILMGGSPDRSMASNAGRALLAHELTHVAQAERGLHRAAKDMELATEEHEAEAQEAEHEEMHEHGGHSSQNAHVQFKQVEGDDLKAKQLSQQVQEMVLQMLGDAMRTTYERSGPRWRRP